MSEPILREAIVPMSNTARKPLVAVLTTGGTIAGRIPEGASSASYRVGDLSASEVLASVPGLDQLAELRVQEVLNIDSSSMSPSHWLTLLAPLLAAVDDDAVVGVVITHGTDTLEETAFLLEVALLDLRPHLAKAIVLVGAMRPANALSAEGPANLLHAVTLASGAGSSGVHVVMNDTIFAPFSVRKQHTFRVDAFTAGEGGATGYFAAGAPFLRRLASDATGAGDPASATALAGVRRYCNTFSSRAVPDQLPQRLARVALLTLHVGFDPDLLAVAATKSDALVIAGFGNGNLGAELVSHVARVAARIPVIRASRVAQGEVISQGANDDTHDNLHTVGELSAVKARALLSWVLAE